MPRTVVILHPGGFGDLLLAAPAIQGLRDRFPSHKFLLCGHDEASRLLAECGLVDCWLPVHSTALTALFGGKTPDDALLTEWLGRCDFAVAWNSDESDVLSAALNRCGARVAVVQSPFTSTLTALHQSERYAAIAGVQTPSVPRLSVSDALKAEGKKCLSYCVEGARPLALVHPGSGSRHKCVRPDIMVQVL
ncbi:MAG TPA: hypothetical protein VFM24_01490, partial [Nitrospira sp.]|nr:hypothetical protein [Nitrospira sp.]